jgi:hypothetical protein
MQMNGCSVDTVLYFHVSAALRGAATQTSERRDLGTTAPQGPDGEPVDNRSRDVFAREVACPVPGGTIVKDIFTRSTAPLLTILGEGIAGIGMAHMSGTPSEPRARCHGDVSISAAACGS